MKTKPFDYNLSIFQGSIKSHQYLRNFLVAFEGIYTNDTYIISDLKNVFVYFIHWRKEKQRPLFRIMNQLHTISFIFTNTKHFEVPSDNGNDSYMTALISCLEKKKKVSKDDKKIISPIIKPLVRKMTQQ